MIFRLGPHEKRFEAELRRKPVDGISLEVPYSNRKVCEESTVSLLDELIHHLTPKRKPGVYIRNEGQEKSHFRNKRRMCHEILLQYKKDTPDNAILHIINRTGELGNQRRFDEATRLEHLWKDLQWNGQLCRYADDGESDAYRILRFLVLLKGQGGKENVKKLTDITPRLFSLNTSSNLPPGPLDYGDTFMYPACTERDFKHYMYYPITDIQESKYIKDVYSLENKVSERYCLQNDELNLMLSFEPPGTGIWWMENQRLENPNTYGRAMGGLVNYPSHKNDVPLDIRLKIPELPNNPDGYFSYPHAHNTNGRMIESTYIKGTSRGSITISNNLTEGIRRKLYDWRSNYELEKKTREKEHHRLMCRCSDDIYDINGSVDWEFVAQLPPVTKCKTWEAGRGNIPKFEKPFVSETGTHVAHRLWQIISDSSCEALAFNLGYSEPLLIKRTLPQLCQDVLYLLNGFDSPYISWSQETASFEMHAGLCTDTLTPDGLKHFFTKGQYIIAGNYIRRLEKFCCNSVLPTADLKRKGRIYINFLRAVQDFVYLYRNTISLWISKKAFKTLGTLNTGLSNLIKNLTFVAKICQVNNTPDTDEEDIENNEKGLAVGLSLLGRLYNELVVVQDPQLYTLILTIFKRSIQPLLRYLEKWIYSGICEDPSGEFMIVENERALSVSHKDRTYWTDGYKLKTLDNIPQFLEDFLQQAYTCGKALNLLKICVPKHYLCWSDAPEMKLCITPEDVKESENRCHQYYQGLQDLQNKFKEAARIREEDRLEHLEQKRRTNQHAKQLREEEKEKHRRLEDERKRAKFAEVKANLEEAIQRKAEIKDREEEKEREYIIQANRRDEELRKLEEKLKFDIRNLYKDRIKDAEEREIKALSELQELDSVQPTPTDESASGTSYDATTPMTPFGSTTPLTPGSSNAPYDATTPSSSSAPYDMTASLMSTSSDVTSTPHNENLPDFEINVEEEKKSQILTKNSLKTRGLALDPNSPFFTNQNVFKEGVWTQQTVCNDNENMEISGLPDDNGNSTISDTIIHNNEVTSNYINIPFEDLNEVTEEVTTTNILSENDTSNFNLNENVLENKDHQNTNIIQNNQSSDVNKNDDIPNATMNLETNRNIQEEIISSNPNGLPEQKLLRPKRLLPLVSPVIAIPENQIVKHFNMKANSWSNQVLGSFEISNKSSSYAQENEAPILIDQVFGAVLKQRGRSIYGHASDTVIHKLFQRQASKDDGEVESSLEDFVREWLDKIANYVPPVKKFTDPIHPRELEKYSPLLDITGTLITGEPAWNENKKVNIMKGKNIELPDATQLYITLRKTFAIHIDAQCRLVNRCLLHHLMTEQKLPDHFQALRSYMLLQDANFGHALSRNLFTGFSDLRNRESLKSSWWLTAVLNQSLSDSSCSRSNSPLVENLSFSVPDKLPQIMPHTSVLECVDLRYRVGWPVNIILDANVLDDYSRIWKFLTYIHHIIWTANDIYMKMAEWSQWRNYGDLSKSRQFRELSFYRHEMHHFLTVIQSYVLNQAFKEFETNFEDKVSSIDQLYELHCTFVKHVTFRCFLTATNESREVHKLVMGMFSLLMNFRTLLLAHTWRRNAESGEIEHPAFNQMQRCHKDFKDKATFLNKCLKNVTDPNIKDLLVLLDFNGHYSKPKITFRC